MSWPLEATGKETESAHLSELLIALQGLKDLPEIQQDPQSKANLLWCKGIHKNARKSSYLPNVLGFWLQLVERGMAHRAVIAALYFFMENGGSEVQLSYILLHSKTSHLSSSTDVFLKEKDHSYTYHTHHQTAKHPHVRCTCVPPPCPNAR